MIVFMLLHYGSHDVTEDCIRSIRSLGLSVLHEILIIDNDPEPSCWDHPHVVKTGDVGFSEANNIGYKYAKDKMGATMVIACNNDLIFEPGKFTGEVLTELNGSGAFVAGPDIEKVGTGEHQSPIALSLRTANEVRKTIAFNKIALALFPVVFPFLKKTLTGKAQVGVDVSDGKPMSDVVPFGACIIFTSEYIAREDRIFYPETKFYYEEYILAARCADSGYKIVYEPRLHVMHVDGAATVSSSKDDYLRIRNKMRNITDAAEVYLKFIG